MNEHITQAHGMENHEMLIPQLDWFERSTTLQKLRKNKKIPHHLVPGLRFGGCHGRADPRH